MDKKSLRLTVKRLVKALSPGSKVLQSASVAQQVSVGEDALRISRHCCYLSRGCFPLTSVASCANDQPRALATPRQSASVTIDLTVTAHSRPHRHTLSRLYVYIFHPFTHQTRLLFFLKVCVTPAYLNAKRLGLFVSLPDEVDMTAIFEHAFAAQKTCFVPRYDADGGMEMYKVR